MAELNEELWKLGILAKTEHNEVAPAQHELAPVFTTTNIAVDHNQLVMEIMQKVAKRHGLVCLLHEKPFDGVNGSGKHNNWAITTNTGLNLLEPGETPYENAQFLLFLCAVIKAVDEYQDLLRISVASAGNDHRLGANEAPPAVVSMFVGDELEGILESLDTDTDYTGKEKELMRIGVHVLPKFPKDSTDRNRTSPFAFTGNKFEFRMLGSAASAASANIVLNTAVAEELKQFADTLESSSDFTAALHELIRKTIHEHKRIIFNGNGYDDAWLAEAEKRGLLNLRTTPECIPYLTTPKNIALFSTHKVLSETELRSRADIMLENYTKLINIEALTMLDMVKKDVLPAASGFTKQLADTACAKKSVLAQADCTYETALVERLSKLTGCAYTQTTELERALVDAKTGLNEASLATYYKDMVLNAMTKLRLTVDELETLVSKDCWPWPTYGELLFDVR